MRVLVYIAASARHVSVKFAYETLSRVICGNITLAYFLTYLLGYYVQTILCCCAGVCAFSSTRLDTLVDISRVFSSPTRRQTRSRRCRHRASSRDRRRWRHETSVSAWSVVEWAAERLRPATEVTCCDRQRLLQRHSASGGQRRSPQTGRRWPWEGHDLEKVIEQLEQLQASHEALRREHERCKSREQHLQEECRHLTDENEALKKQQAEDWQRSAQYWRQWKHAEEKFVTLEAKCRCRRSTAECADADVTASLHVTGSRPRHKEERREGHRMLESRSKRSSGFTLENRSPRRSYITLTSETVTPLELTALANTFPPRLTLPGHESITRSGQNAQEVQVKTTLPLPPISHRDRRHYSN